MGRDRGFIDENNSSNESLDENVPLPVSKSTPIIKQKQKQTKKKKISTFCRLQPSLF